MRTLGKNNKNREEFRGRRGGKEKKETREKGRGKRDNKSKKEVNYLNFVSLFNICPYDRKTKAKQGRPRKFQGGREKIFYVAIIYTPVEIYCQGWGGTLSRVA